MGKARDLLRSDKRKKDQHAVDALKGCPCPGSKGCLIGRAAVESDESLQLECSNKQCPFREEKTHVDCFNDLVDSLLKALACTGSGRGWTPSQRHINLFQKKGLAIIGHLCICQCGKGRYSPPDSYVQSIRAAEIGVDIGGSGRKERGGVRGNKKKLPAVNMSGAGKAQAMLAERMFTHDRERFDEGAITLLYNGGVNNNKNNNNNNNNNSPRTNGNRGGGGAKMREDSNSPDTVMTENAHKQRCMSLSSTNSEGVDGWTGNERMSVTSGCNSSLLTMTDDDLTSSTQQHNISTDISRASSWAAVTERHLFPAEKAVGDGDFHNNKINKTDLRSPLTPMTSSMTDEEDDAERAALIRAHQQQQLMAKLLKSGVAGDVPSFLTAMNTPPKSATTSPSTESNFLFQLMQELPDHGDFSFRIRPEECPEWSLWNGSDFDLLSTMQYDTRWLLRA